MEKPNEYISIVTPLNSTRMAMEPWGKPYDYYDKMRYIGVSGSMTWAWVTFDKEIKTPRDLVGKTISVGREAALRTPDEQAILKEWGVLDEVRLIHGGYGGAMGALKDGLADVACLTFDHIYPAGFSKGPLITNLETKGPIYYIGMDPDMMERLRNEESGFETMSVRVPPGALDPKTQPTELWAGAFPTFFGADERMDEDIVYEVTRVLYESAGKFATWHPQGAHMTEDWIPTLGTVKKETHLGAQKYYDEHGIEVKYLGDLLR